MKLLDKICSNIKKVAVLYGGNSAEREISLVSGNRVYESLAQQKIDTILVDIAEPKFINQLLDNNISHAFIAVHGKLGEDGSLQGLLDILKIPYTGSNVVASAISMHKYKSKLILKSFGVKTPNATLIDQLSNLSVYQDYMPAFVKPCTAGSSFGVSKIATINQIPQAYQQAKKYCTEVIIEQAILGDEVTVGILQDQALPALVIKTAGEFYDYNAKYKQDTTSFSLAEHLTEQQTKQLQQLSLNIFNILGCSSWGRVDFIQDCNGEFWFLEINTVPGMSSRSLVPTAANYLGINFDQLVLNILATTFNK